MVNAKFVYSTTALEIIEILITIFLSTKSVAWPVYEILMRQTQNPCSVFVLLGVPRQPLPLHGITVQGRTGSVLWRAHKEVGDSIQRRSSMLGWNLMHWDLSKMADILQTSYVQGNHADEVVKAYQYYACW